MKNFGLGVLITLTFGLFMQNISLREQLVIAQKSQATYKNVAVKKTISPKPKPAPKIVKKQIQIVEEAPTVAYSSKDPRCPDHLPYWTSYWGCVVKRP